MAFVVEDGTGLATATSYTDETFADAHHTDRGNTDWTSASSGAKQVALILATDAMDQLFRYRGRRKTAEQALLWPRTAVFTRVEHDEVDSNSVPIAVQKATAELALAQVQGTILQPNSIPGSSADRALTETKKAGSLSVTQTFKEIRSRPVFHKASCYVLDLTAADELLRA